MSIDDFIRTCGGLPVSATSITVFGLEMKRLIRQFAGEDVSVLFARTPAYYPLWELDEPESRAKLGCK